MHTNTQKEFDREVVRAWTDAGALVGWLARSEFGEWQYLQNRPPNVESLPVFFWPKEAFDAASIDKLPAPSVPFAMCLQSTRFDSNRFDELKAFQNLQDLDLSHAAKLSDSWLWDLRKLRNLRSLDLGATDVKDDAMKPLSRIQSLRNLYLGSDRGVTDAGLKTLTRLKNLQTLYLYNTTVTDDGLTELAACKSLQTLLLYKTQITDDGLKALAGLPSLQTLGLISTAITDMSLKEMEGPGFTGLRTVHISETQTTQNGRAQLARARPDLRILY